MLWAHSVSLCDFRDKSVLIWCLYSKYLLITISFLGCSTNQGVYDQAGNTDGGVSTSQTQRTWKLLQNGGTLSSRIQWQGNGFCSGWNWEDWQRFESVEALGDL